MGMASPGPGGTWRDLGAVLVHDDVCRDDVNVKEICLYARLDAE
jgi:hypothetical protein